MEHINCYFSTFCYINESFKKRDNPLAIDYEKLNETYEFINTLPEVVKEQVMISIRTVLRRPGKKLQNIKDIRFLLIIFECPFLYHNNTNSEILRNHEILKRLFGIISCLSKNLYKYMVTEFTKFTEEDFKRKVEIINYFISYRVTKIKDMDIIYPKDWAIKAASKFMTLLYGANSYRNPSLPISEFYNMAIDLVNICTDYNNWQNNQFKGFSFCYYPCIISLGQKIKILRMESQQYLQTLVQNNISRNTPLDIYFVVHVRRDHLIEDSIEEIQLALKNNTDMKKLLKVIFIGEAGVDAGGLRKEWLYLLVKKLFSPNYGMFEFDETTQLCWFSPASFENENQYKLLGIIIGLAIYNGIILDIRLPLACYKRLRNYSCNLDDLREIHPQLARSFDQILSYEGDDMEDVLCTNFVATYSEFDRVVEVPLIENGENIFINKSNRKDYVERYLHWFFVESVQKQFEAFKEGFKHLCPTNFISICTPGEIQKIILGEEEIDMERLKNVTIYKECDQNTRVVKWFWEIVSQYDVKMKKKLMFFVTGSDRICPTGIEHMKFKITYFEDRTKKNYLPLTHTCFNEIILFTYDSKEVLEDKLKQAIFYSEGFGIK